MYAPKYGELEGKTHKELVELYDRLAENTAVGTNFVLEEIRRRTADRAAAANRRIALAAIVVSVVIGCGSLALGGVQLWVAAHRAAPVVQVVQVPAALPPVPTAPPPTATAPPAPRPGL